MIQLSASFPDGVTAPNNNSLIALPAASPGSPIYKSPFTFLIQGSSITLPHISTTITFSLTSAAASIIRRCPSGICIVSRSNPSDSYFGVSPANTTTLFAFAAASLTSFKSSSVVLPSDKHPCTKGTSGQASVTDVSFHGLMWLLPAP